MNDKVRENHLWAWLRRVEKWLGHRRGLLDWRRVENAVSVGDPDVEGCFSGGCFNIELKAVARTAMIEVGLRPHQAQWIRRRALAGGWAFVLVQVGSDHDARRYLISCHDVIKLLQPIAEIDLEKMALIPPTCKPKDVLNHVSLHRNDSSLDLQRMFRDQL